MINLNLLKKEIEKEIEKVQNLRELNLISKRYLGKEGKISLVLHSLKSLPTSKRAKIGKEANDLKGFLEEEIRKLSLQLRVNEKKKEEFFDITIPGEEPRVGHLHPLTQVKREVENIFQSMGFFLVEGYEIEDEYHNFDALNIPKDHPARDMWDTLWLKTRDKALLRTHTSPVQIRYMQKHKPPLRIIAPGRVFRYEATDASHEINFYQVEGLMVDKKGVISISSFKSVIENFSKVFFGEGVKIRLRPSYFPFTEPSFEVDVSCPICGGKGCKTCQYSGWVEALGAGMVHPNVLKNCQLDPRKWQGFAFGLGLDRLAMIKYKIPDIRLFFSGDLRFLKQF